MEKFSPYIKTLKEIDATQAYELLQGFEESSIWTSLTDEERKLLAKLFHLQGIERFKETPFSIQLAKKAFELSCLISPPDFTTKLREIKAFAAMISSSEALEEAENHLKTLSCENDLEVWLLWGDVSIKQAILSKDPSKFFDADQIFTHANGDSPFSKEENHRLAPQFYWRWATCWHHMAKHSGEPHDFHQAILKYQTAQEWGQKDPLFYNDFGNALVDLACMISQNSLLTQALSLYRMAINQAPNFFEGWFNLACCEQRLWQITHQDNFFEESHNSFKKASEINRKDAPLWFKWGQLLASVGKKKRNLKLLFASLKKFQRADHFHPNHEQILLASVEIEVIIGSYTERFDRLKKAEKKILKCLKLSPENPHAWYLYGLCLQEIGIYFADESIIEKAIEKLHQGLSVDRSYPLIWYGLGQAYLNLSDYSEDIYLLEKSLHCFQRFMELQTQPLPHHWNDWGIVLMKMADASGKKVYLEMALEKFEIAIKLYGRDHDLTTVNPDWLYNYGVCLDLLGDATDQDEYYEKAVQVLSQTLMLDPGFTQARYHLALALTHLGDSVSDVECIEKAMRLFEELIQEDREDEIVWNDWGLALIHLSQIVEDVSNISYMDKLHQEAEGKFLQAAALGNTQAFYNLACLYSLAGNNRISLYYLEKARSSESLPSFEEIMQDDWLENLRSSPHFRDFLTDLKLRGFAP